MTAQFRTLAHSIGFSTKAIADYFRVANRSAAYWMGNGRPPEPVLAELQEMAARVDAAVAALVSRSPCELTAYHDESQWWKANPDFQGFLIQCHSIILQKALDELKSLGNNVSIRYFDDVQETDGKNTG